MFLILFISFLDLKLLSAGIYHFFFVFPLHNTDVWVMHNVIMLLEDNILKWLCFIQSFFPTSEVLRMSAD